MQDISNFSGNVKLRLPKSLHYALTEQAEKEGISLNQLCLMYLSSSLAEYHLGTEQFNRRLEKMEILCGSNEEMLFKELEKLNDEVEVLKPLLLKAIKDIIEKNARSIGEQMEALSYIYPIYCGRAEYPYIKVPSAKVVLCPNKNQFIDYKEIEEAVKIVSNTYIAHGDFDYYLPLEKRIPNKERIMSVVINVCCEFKELFTLILKIKNLLKDAGYEKKGQILIKPCYLYIDTSYLLDDIYGEKIS